MDVTEVPIKVLIITQSITRFKPVAGFLARRGVTTFLHGDIKRAFEVLASDRPTLVLVSWNLRTAPAKKIIEMVQQKFGIPVVAFAEESDAMTAAGLAGSGVDEIIHAPVSGPVIFMRIQRVLKSLEGKTPTLRPPPRRPADQDQIAVSPEAISREAGAWVKESERGKSGVWRFRPEKDSVRGTYLFYGELPPIRGSDGSWKIQPGELFFSERESGPSAEALAHLRNLLTSMMTNTQKALKTDEFRTGVIEILSSSIRGYLLIQTDAPWSDDFLRMYKSALSEVVNLYGRGMRTSISFTWADSRGSGFSRLRAKEDFDVEGNIFGKSVHLGFIQRETPKVPMGDKVRRGKTAVPIETFSAESEVPFDVFLDLPRNGKFLRLYKKGQKIDPLRTAGLRSRNVQELYISQESWTDFQAFDAERFLQKTLDS